MLTAAQFERLPELLQDIVMADRALVTVRAGLAAKVLPIASLHLARKKLQDRRELSAAAEQLWGHRLASDGPARC